MKCNQDGVKSTHSAIWLRIRDHPGRPPEIRMAVTQADIDALNAAIAKGERVVRLGDKSVEYRSITELIAARNDLAAQLAEAANAASAEPRSRQTYLYQSGRGHQ